MRKLTISLLLVALVATVGLGWLFDQIYNQYYLDEQSLGRDKTHDVEQLGTTLAKALDALDNRQEFVLAWQQDQESSPKGMQQYSLTLVTVKESRLPDLLLNDTRQGTALLLETNNRLSYYFYLPEHAELLVLSSVLDNDNTEAAPLNYIFTSLFYITLLLLFFLWAFPLVRQLLVLRQAAKSFGGGELKQRIELGSFSYIRDIELEFNHMAQRIEDLVGDVKLLSSAVSHDLRTPLARIRFGIDTLQEEDDPDLRRKFEAKVSDNVDEMTSLIETLLAYSRLDQTMLELKKEEIDLPELISQCIEKNDSESTDVTFYNSVVELKIIADKNYLTIMINNLLQNAIKYGNGELMIQLFSENEIVTLLVEDNGGGVDSDMRERVFLPFIRGNQASKQDDGHGVGLAIVKRIVQWHKGNISVGSSETLTGAKFTVILPQTR